MLISFIVLPVGASSNQDSTKNCNHVKLQGIEDEQIYEEVITLSEEEIVRLKGNSKNNTIYIDPKTFNQGKKKYINPDKIKIDLEADHVKAAKKDAQKNGHKWSLGSMSITTKFKKEDGTYLTVDDYKKIKSERGKYGIEKSFEIISENELTKLDTTQYSTSSLELGDAPPPKTYRYVTTVVYVYNEDSGAQRRHYVVANHVWSKQWSWGAITTHDFDYKPDLLAGGWSYGRIADNAPRDAYVVYENVNGRQITRDDNTLTRYEAASNNGYLNAWKVDERIGDYRIKSAQVYNYTGWYYPGRAVDDGEFRTLYVHGFAQETLNIAVGLTTSGVALNVTPTKTTQREIATHYAFLKIN